MSQHFDPTRSSEEIQRLQTFLGGRLVGQDHILKTLSPVFQRYEARLHNPRRPIAGLLFLGPTGVGKSYTFDLLAEYFFGTPDARIRVDCAAFQHDSDVSKLVGSPPGYIGHKTTPAIFKQANLNKHYNDKWKFSLVVFDEIEKANEALWEIMLSITGAGELPLGDNTVTDFRSTIIGLTSNLGSAQMASLEDRSGFAKGTPLDIEDMDTKKEAAAIRAARKRFSPEFIGRLRTGVFHSLRRPDLEAVLDLELDAVQNRVMSAQGCAFTVSYADAVKEWLLNKGTSWKDGARHLTDLIDTTLVSDLSNLKATGQLKDGDRVYVSLDSKEALHYEPLALI